jgi:hypothetical protein
MQFKILLSFILILLIISSCEEPQVVQVRTNELVKHSKYYDTCVEEYTYEGCEYIVVDFGSSKWGSHKGNCKNPIHSK